MAVPPKTPAIPASRARAKKIVAPDVPAPGSDDENEVLRETRAAIAHRKDGSAAKNAGNGAKRDWKAAAGIGVGSAALLAALLYANRQKK